MANTQREILYTAKMKHNAETIEKLVLMQYNTFQVGKKIIKIVIALAMLVYGVFTSGSGMFTSYLCLFLGSVMIAGLNVRAKSNAKKLNQQIKGKYPSSDYFFSKTGFRDSEEGKEIPYSRLIKVIDDKKYLYLYVSRESAYMVNGATVFGDGKLEGLKNLITEKTGLKWTNPSSFWNFNINSVRDMMSGGTPSYKGERLDEKHRTRWF